MSDTDSFIDEVTEEVRRDRLFGLMRRYGWIAALAVLLLVGGAAFNEWRKARAQATAEATGDAMIAALRIEDPAERATALAALDPESPAAAAVAAMLEAGEMIEAGEAEAAAGALQTITQDSDLPLIYRQLAQFKLLAVQGEDLSIDERRSGYQGLIGPASQLTLLAEEQLALIDIEAGESMAAAERLQRIATDPQATAGLRRRASQLMVALGVTPEEIGNDDGTGGQAASGAETNGG